MILTVDGKRVNNLVRGKTYRYVYNVRFDRAASNVRFGMLIKTINGLELGGGVSASGARDSLALVSAGTSYRMEFRFVCALNTGVYFLNAGVTGDVAGSETYLHRMVDIAMFRVLADTDDMATGTIDFSCDPDVELLQSIG
jgi:lipopolysaccharide transport system ATP-binding protein